MALQAGDIIRLARHRHAALRPTSAPQVIAYECLGRAQRELFLRGSSMDAYFGAQTTLIVFDVDVANTPAQVTAGASGGLPIDVDSDGIDLATGPAGGAASWKGALMVVDRVKPTAASSTGGKIPGTYTLNRLQGGIARIDDGPGAGEEREIASSLTDGTFTVVGTWDLTVDSLVTVYRAATLATDGGAITQLPAYTEARRYLVRLDATGAAYIDFTKPLLARFGAPLALPPMLAVLDGTVHFADPQTREKPFLTVPRGQRHAKAPYFSGHLMNGRLYLHGTAQEWKDVQNLELQYVPDPEDPVSDSDYLLLGDDARDALVARTAGLMAERLIDTDVMSPAAIKSVQERADQDVARWVDQAIGGVNKVETLYVSDTLP